MPSSRTLLPPRNARVRGKEMTIYYRGRDAHITHDVFEVRWPQPYRYLIRDLRDVQVVRGGPGRVAIGGASVAGAASVAIAASWPLLNTPVAWAAALVALATPCVVGGACWRLARPVYELRATYRQLPVQLFASQDPQAFGQVRRALLRAIEHHDEESGQW